MRPARIVPLVVATALFMENTDSTVIATSLPAIAADLGEDPIALKLALTSYLVSLAIFIPVSGWMADRFGARTVFRLALAVFMGGSLACAAADSLGWFVGARFLQGMGGAMMVPVGRLVLLRSVPKAELVQALATLTIPALVGPVIGPPLGGLITTTLNWRWIFFINLPIGLAGILLATRYFADLREAERPPLDGVGFVLSGAGLASLMLGLASGGRHLLPASVSWGCVGAGLALLALYCGHARRTAHPLIRLDLMGYPTFRAAITGGSLFRIGTGAIPFLLPLMLQLGFGLDPLHSGLLTFAAAAGALFMKTLAARILRSLGFRTVLTVNAVLAACLLAANGLFTPSTPHALIVAVLLIGGCFRSLQFTAVNAIAYADVDSRDMSAATSLASVAQQLSLSIGVAFGAFALESAAQWHGRASVRSEDFWPAFLAVALVSGLSAFAFARLAPTAGAEVSGHRRVTARPAADAT
ncbi:major facilitator superfamily MFS_1 [Methylobacterium sp. 4-46]|uniref:DHA2 family efflux MFS transporter permease subunit n=1 Tax=unclassified Methylobacterium TaxID=2615210 RepID=UPI000152E865|nr:MULTISPECIES: DHA2 family efflux MFS transporter permease subunit [Methylobacterium]ACA15639.1 major facilitator superfamily MFS_1 [Methylobacterium sp. 4-46]WFT81351.1 DHA2 family efflux MFS transporter permease subunit [Methylobacterium nodulans]